MKKAIQAQADLDHAVTSLAHHLGLVRVDGMWEPKPIAETFSESAKDLLRRHGRARTLQFDTLLYAVEHYGQARYELGYNDARADVRAQGKRRERLVLLEAQAIKLRQEIATNEREINTPVSRL